MTVSRDDNRFRKVYPVSRRVPSETILIKDLNLDLEAAAVTFDNSDMGSHTFVLTFALPPLVTLGVIDAGPDDMGAQVWITSVSTTSVNLEASVPFTGEVHIHASLGTLEVES